LIDQGALRVSGGAGARGTSGLLRRPLARTRVTLPLLLGPWRSVAWSPFPGGTLGGSISLPHRLDVYGHHRIGRPILAVWEYSGSSSLARVSEGGSPPAFLFPIQFRRGWWAGWAAGVRGLMGEGG